MKIIDTIKEKKENLVTGKYRKEILLILVFLIFFSFGFLLKKTVLKKSEKSIETVTDEKIEYKKSEKAKENLENTNIASVDKRLNINLSEKIKAKINYEAFKKDFDKFLEDNKLYTENTTATSDNSYEESEDGEISFNLKLNNLEKTDILVTYKNNKYLYEYR